MAFNAPESDAREGRSIPGGTTRLLPSGFLLHIMRKLGEFGLATTPAR
jgi:hypothetical protein